MIDASRNFDEGVAFLLSDLEKDINSKLLLQNNFLDSRRFNETMKNIEDELNLLYEKTRVLEDMISYTKEFVQQEIHLNKEKLYDKLKTIEDHRDTMKESAYISYRAPLETKNAEVIRDRDGTVLDRCDIDNGYLVLSGQELETIRVVDVTKKQELTAYQDNLEESKTTKHYRSFYLLDGPASNGVKEELTFMFEDTKTVNSISGVPVNCEILSATLINENGAEEQVVLLENSTIAEKRLKGVKITIIARNYQTHVYEIESNRLQYDFWSKVAAYEYGQVLGQNSTFDFESASGVDQYKEDYEAYLAELEEWKAEKQAVEERNRLKLLKYAEDLEAYKAALAAQSEAK
ncbi:hypothetical protein [Heyndrickxia sporothermodurans]|uniref:hypothetical protein n=1 Tax=Heyndrickxia sporothermodurans TaxID=46224 RepID=UPI000D367DA4|nr:hypothetical protein [Heyndrickxia sporothermodurans]PTY93102.1 hypothetical protein B5V90_03180 [Heyndrickxia sporothermodurans]